MIEARIPDNERQRLAALRSYDILDTDPELGFDDLTQIASRLCGTPISLVSLVDEQRQWFKSKVGLDASETPRSVAYCSHAILEPDSVFVVPDAFEDERFHDNPLATGAPHVRFYAGAPLVNPAGMALGTLCVIDSQPREISEEDRLVLQGLARQVVSQLELRRRALELRSVARDLEVANQDLREFTSVAAHDLREPLRKVISFGGLLREDLGQELSEQADEDLSFMVHATQRMQALLDDLLNLARTGNSSMSVTNIELGECAERAREALSVRIEESGAQIVFDSLPAVRADATLVTQLFQNLFSNALKFVRGRAPEIRVSATETDEGVEVVVADNGIGIDSAHVDQIFRPFKRLHGRSAFEGTGIGLSIVQKAVERHGGRIWIDSTPGEGSEFHFVLPRAEASVTV